MIERILDSLIDIMQPSALVKPGQLVWLAVPVDGPKYTHQPMEKLPKKRVTLDLITLEDIKRFEKGVPIPVIRRHRQARLIRQTRAQGAALALSDVSLMTLMAGGTVSTDLKRYQRENGCVLPYRGVEHDTGPTCTHKVEVIRLLDFAGIPVARVALYPLAQQTAEKIHAHTFPWENRDKTCVKDLVDLMLMLQSERLEPERVRQALVATFETRGTHPLPAKLPAPPREWDEPYAALAA